MFFASESNEKKNPRSMCEWQGDGAMYDDDSWEKNKKFHLYAVRFHAQNIWL